METKIPNNPSNDNRLKSVVKATLARLALEKGYPINSDNIQNVTCVVYDKMIREYKSSLSLLDDNFESRVISLMDETNKIMYDIVEILLPQNLKHKSETSCNNFINYNVYCKDYKYVCVSPFLLKAINSGTTYFRRKLTDVLINSGRYDSEDQVDKFFENGAVGFDDKDCCKHLALEVLNYDDFVGYYNTEDESYEGCFIKI